MKRIGQTTWVRKKRKDAFDENRKKQVQDFYKRETNCTYLPIYKLVNKDDEACGYLNKTIAELHNDYTQEYGNIISLSKFQKWKPKESHVMGLCHFDACLCEICMEEFATALARLLGRKIDSTILRHTTLCDRLFILLHL